MVLSVLFKEFGGLGGWTWNCQPVWGSIIDIDSYRDIEFFIDIAISIVESISTGWNNIYPD